MAETTIDLDRLDLRSGQAATRRMELEPEPPSVGGISYPYVEEVVPARIDVSKTTSGFALRLRAETVAVGPCSRCTEPAEVPLGVDVREVDQQSSDDLELISPYVGEGLLDAEGWLHDGLVLALPEKVLCRPDCRGICDVCGVSLNEVDPEAHHHEKPLDPRFAKLRELSGE